jgi:hypothetical protein
MKLDNNLRAAVRSVCKASAPLDRETLRTVYRQAVEKFIGRNPKLWERRIKAHAKAVAAAQKADARVKAAGAPFDEAGLSTWRLPELQVQDHDTFLKAGGELPPLSVARNPDALISKLASASQQEGAAILKELGIKWE